MAKKALVIGIYYKIGKSARIDAGDDAIIVASHLRDRKYTDVRLMLDKDTKDWESFGIGTFLREDFLGGKVLPTKNNITNAMEWLVKDAKSGDRLFLFFAGHGGQIKDKDGDEKKTDKLDEYIATMDDKKLTDDEMHGILIKGLPKGVRLNAVFDCCHSGTILDLRYLENKGKLRTNTSKHDSDAHVVLLSGCKDNETADDSDWDDNTKSTNLGLLAGGLFTHALAKYHNAGDKEAPTFNELLKSIREYVRQKEVGSKYHQSVQMSTSLKFDLDEEKYRI